MFNGLDMSLGNLPLLSGARSFSLSPENFTGKKGGGAMAVTGPCEEFAADLGKGWKISPCVRIEPGDTLTIADVEGPGAIQSIWMTGRGFGRDAILRFYWDDQQNPSVECPGPDFFAFGWNSTEGGTNNGFPLISALPIHVAPSKGYSCFWNMPFRKRCRITIENAGMEQMSFFFQINYTLTEVPDNAAYFHAQWRRSNPVPYKQVHTVLDGVMGEGHYAGVAMFVGLNGANGWWGEGEMKFYLDGDDEYPTICGTGLEDYFLGAYDWSVNGKYVPHSFPFSGMYQVIAPSGDHVSQQRFGMYRFHIMDPIRFAKDLRITVQDLGWRSNPRRFLARQDDITTVAYWYQTLPTASFPIFPSKDEREII